MIEVKEKMQEMTKEKWPDVAPDFIPLVEAMDAMRKKHEMKNITMRAYGGTVKVNHISESEGCLFLEATKNEEHPDVYYVDAYNGEQTEILGYIPCGEEGGGKDGNTEGQTECEQAEAGNAEERAECAQAGKGTEENHKFIWIETE